MHPPRVRISGLVCSFRGRLVFRVDELAHEGNGIVCLSGSNGSGKTSFLRILATLADANGGNAWIDGLSVRQDAAQVRSRLGWCAATDGGFYRELTGFENLTLFGASRGIEPHDVNQHLEALREVLPIGEALRTPFGACSSGMRQSLQIARALMHDPRVLLLDEPTRSLDRESAAALRLAMRELARECLLIIATHRDDELELADAVWTFREGTVTAAPRERRKHALEAPAPMPLASL
jgi:ABC-2 type transport system ATP-binding protein